MRPLFAMAGPAEAGLGAELMVSCGGLLIIALVAAIGFFARSRFATIAAILLAFASTCLCVPWGWLAPRESDDPDVHYWVGQCRVVFAVWVVAATATLAAWVRVIVLATDASPESASMDVPQLPPAETGAESLGWGIRVVWILVFCLALLCLVVLAR